MVLRDPRSPAVWRPSNAARFDFARRHTFTADQLARGFFRPGRPGPKMETTRLKRAHRWLAKQLKRGRIKCRGAVQLNDTGRSQLVYGRRAKDLAHNVTVAEVEVTTGWRIEPDAKVGKTEADGVTLIDGRRFF